MSDTSKPMPEAAQYSSGESIHGTNVSPLLLGCGALLLALLALGVLAGVTFVIVAVHPDAAPDGRRHTGIAMQTMPAQIESVSPSRSYRRSNSPRSHAQRLESSRRAIENGKQALTANPNNAGTLNNLAWAYATAPEELRDGDQAVVLAERAVLYEPGNQNYINTLGTAYCRAGRNDEAIATLERNVRERTDQTVAFDMYPLAMSYFALDQTDKAKKMYKLACESHRRHEARLASNHWHQMYEMRIEAATLFLEEAPQELFERAGDLARKGQWEEAASLFEKGLDVYSADHWSWYQSGALQAYLERSDEYGNHCRRMLELFGSTQDAYIAERTGKLCLLLPGAAPNDSRPARLIDKAVGMQPDAPWFLLASAIAKYRAGQFRDALERLQRAETQSGDQRYCNALIELFRATSQHQLGEKDAAKASLERAIGLLNSTAPKAKDETAEDESLDYGSNWHDRLICEVILREAQALITAEDAVPTQPGGESASKASS